MDSPEFDFLSRFDGDPAQFWPKLNLYAKKIFLAEASCVLLEHKTQQGAQDVRILAQDHPRTSHRISQAGVWQSLDLADPEDWSEPSPGLTLVGLPTLDGPRLWLVLLESSCLDPDSATREARLLVTGFFARRQESRSKGQVLNLAEVLDLGLELGQSNRFNAAAIKLCHRVAGATGAARVCLGWRDIPEADFQLLATSHGGRIQVETQEAEAICRLMDEAADQNNEVAYPAISGSDAIAREHKLFSQDHQKENVLSIPMREPGTAKVYGVLTLERTAEEGNWQEQELDRLRLAADLVTPRMKDLYLASGWWGKRAWRGVKTKAAGLIGPENTGWKLLAVSVVAIIIALALIPIEHKVRSSFLLRADTASIATAPFSGYIESVSYSLGDLVKENQTLLTLDRKELLLDEANGQASRDMHEREARSMEAQGKLAEALMADAQRRQDDARLAILSHRLGKTEIRSPFNGVVVEGDLRERLNSPVQLGEPLVKVVQLDKLYAQLQIDERDIGYVKSDMEGEIAFASRPSEKFAVKVEHFEPVAEVRPEGTMFLVRVRVDAKAQEWWRPGMSGLCKVTVNERSLLWVLTHRTWETLRLWLWV